MSSPAFKYRPTLRRTLLTFILSCAILIVADQLIGVIIQHITSEPPRILVNNGHGIAHFWNLTEAGIAPITFLGSSQMHADASPSQFDSDINAQTGTQVSSVNLSVIGSTVITMRNILDTLLVPYHVHTIFFGLEMRSLRTGNRQDYWFQQYQESPLGTILTQPFPPERSALLWFMEHSTIFRYRVNLHSWLAGQPSPTDDVDLEGHWLLDKIANRGPDALNEEYIPFHPDPQYEQALDDIATVCQQDKLDCIFMNMPLHPQAYRYISAQDNAAYRNVLLKIAQAHGIPIWDFDTDACHAFFPDALFYDLNHFNQDGAKVFTDSLAALYIQQRINPSQSLRDNCAQIIQ